MTLIPRRFKTFALYIYKIDRKNPFRYPKNLSFYSFNLTFLSVMNWFSYSGKKGAYKKKRRLNEITLRLNSIEIKLTWFNTWFNSISFFHELNLGKNNSRLQSIFFFKEKGAKINRKFSFLMWKVLFLMKIEFLFFIIRSKSNTANVIFEIKYLKF